MWAVGICERCGTVTAFRTTNPVALRLMRGKTYYCPVCGVYRLLNVRAVPNADELDSCYNELRVGIILDSSAESDRYNASDETTEQLIKKYRDPRKPWWANEDPTQTSGEDQESDRT